MPTIGLGKKKKKARQKKKKPKIFDPQSEERSANKDRTRTDKNDGMRRHIL